MRQLAFGYATQCNIRCSHCVAAGESITAHKMDLDTARALVAELGHCGVTGISFTAGEPLLHAADIGALITLAHQAKIYTRVVTNGFWAKTDSDADQMVSWLRQIGLCQLRISFSRWHQQHIPKERIIAAARSCLRHGLDYFISFVTDFSAVDDPFEDFLRHEGLKYFPEPLLYLGRANHFNKMPIFTDYPPQTCAMNTYLSPQLDMYACCDAGLEFSNTNAFYIGNRQDLTLDALFRRKEQNALFDLVQRMGLSAMASYIGIAAREIVTYRRCELCALLFNNPQNLEKLKTALTTGLLAWHR